jgi:hypothetical protein
MVSESCAPSTRPPPRRNASALAVPLYQEHYQAIRTSCAALLAEPEGSAKAALKRSVLRYVDHSTPNGDLLSHLVAEALLQRFDRGLVENSNVYVQNLEHSQTTLFYLMAEAVPFVRASHVVANRMLLDGIGDADTACLLELGTGRGMQLSTLLERIAEEKRRMRRLDIIGIDPVEDNLLATERHLSALRRRLGFELHFKPVHGLIERLSLAQVRDLMGGDCDALIINSAFTFHHTRHALFDEHERTAILRRFRRLEPAVITLAEPNADHDTENVLERLQHGWRHFSHLFELVDESRLNIPQRMAIKAHFFGREIRDLFAVDDHYRCERHEPWQRWRDRLIDAGYAPRPVPRIDLQLPESCGWESENGCVRLMYRDEVLVAVLGYRA